MKKKLIITESQYKRLINEQEDYTEQLLSLINSNDETNIEMVKEIAPGQGIDLFDFLKDNIKQIEAPYFYKFNLLGLTNRKGILEILKYIFGNNISVDFFINKNYDETSKEEVIYGSIDKKIYHEKWGGYWSKYEYDSRGNETYYENSKGDWKKSEYDSNGNNIFYKYNDGFWLKREFDENGNTIYSENSNGYLKDDRIK